MPLPSSNKDQSKDDFLSSCMANDTMKGEFPKESQRYAVCQSKYKRAKSEGSAEWDDREVDESQYILY